MWRGFDGRCRTVALGAMKRISINGALRGGRCGGLVITVPMTKTASRTACPIIDGPSPFRGMTLIVPTGRRGPASPAASGIRLDRNAGRVLAGTGVVSAGIITLNPSILRIVLDDRIPSTVYVSISTLP